MLMAAEASTLARGALLMVLSTAAAANVPRKARLLAWEEGMPGSALRAVLGRCSLMRCLSICGGMCRRGGEGCAGEGASGTCRPAGYWCYHWWAGGPAAGMWVPAICTISWLE